MWRQTWKHYIILCLIALGILFEILKSVQLKNGQSFKENNDFIDSDLQPYSLSRQSKKKDLSQLQKKQLNEMNRLRMRFSQIHENINKKEALPQAPPSPEKNNEETETIKKKNYKQLKELVKKSTKDMEKKKKAAAEALKKKKAAEALAQKQKEQEERDQLRLRQQSQYNDDRFHQNQNSDFQNNQNQWGGGYTHATEPPQTPTPEEDPQSTLIDREEWIRRIFNQPSLEETNKLIKYQQSNLIKSEDFYFIVQLMINDSNTRMQELGIVAAHATPSFSSFIVLSQFLITEPYGSPLRTQATQALQRYTEINYLSIIESVYLASGEPPAVRERALSLLIDSAQRNLAVAKATPEDSRTSIEAQTAQRQKNIKRYSDILAELEHMLNNPKETPSVLTAINSTLSTLKNLLKG